MGLKEEAQRVWEVENEKARHERAMEEAVLAKAAFREMFGEAIGALEGRQISKDGLTFLYVPDERAFILRGKCLLCGEECWGGQEIRSLLDLGCVLERFVPNHAHPCPGVAQRPSWGERMQALIREALEQQWEPGSFPFD